MQNSKSLVTTARRKTKEVCQLQKEKEKTYNAGLRSRAGITLGLPLGKLGGVGYRPSDSVVLGLV